MRSSTAKARPAIGLGVLDALRGLAALYVVLYHARTLLWWPDWAAHYTLGNVLWNAARFGQVSVLLFFLISGFCIHYRQARQLAHTKTTARRPLIPLDLGSYASRRFWRLYPPLLVALVLTALFDYFGGRVNPAYYAGQSQYGLPFQMSDHNWWTLVGNLAVQGNLSVPTFGSDGPLWSLSYEVWFYALYPIVLLASARFGIRGILAIAGVSAVAIADSVRVAATGPACPFGCAEVWIPSLLAYWIVWTAGAVIAEAYAGRIQIRGLRVAVIPALVVLGGLMANAIRPVVHLDFTVSDMLFSATLAVLLAWLLLRCPGALAPWVERGAARLSPLGNMSYSLYLVHMPWLFFLAASWITLKGSLPGGVELFCLGVLGALVIAGACWFLVERHFTSRRRTTENVGHPTVAKLGAAVS
jgi:peptidoglycan/LPS O-acetylase OafA/YrhL